jgi:hypothetical protein
MTKRIRRNRAPAFKAKVALAALEGEKTLGRSAGGRLCLRAQPRLGEGDAFFEKPRVHLVIAFDPRARHEEPLSRQANLVLDLAFLPT